jgi:hypothetical protein
VARGEQLPRDCETDNDCLIVEVRPGIPTVTNQSFDAAEVLHLIREYEDSCPPFNVTYQYAASTCELENGERVCVLAIEPLEEGSDMDASDSFEEDGDLSCFCESDEECPSEMPFCESCACRDECGVACYRVLLCGLLDDLEYQTIDDCSDSCRSFESFDPAGARELVDCLTSATCSNMVECTY